MIFTFFSAIIFYLRKKFEWDIQAGNLKWWLSLSLKRKTELVQSTKSETSLFSIWDEFLLGDADVLVVQVDSIKHVEAGQAGQESQAPGEGGQGGQRGVGGEGRHDGPDPVQSDGHHQVGGARQTEGLEKFEQLTGRVSKLPLAVRNCPHKLTFK